MRFINLLILVSSLLMVTSVLSATDQKVNQELKILKEKVETIEKNND
jgi:hypothetical protein